MWGGDLVVEVEAVVLKSMGEGGEELASSSQQQQGDGLTSSLGRVGTGREHRAVCGGGLVEVAVLLEVGFEPKRVVVFPLTS